MKRIIFFVAFCAMPCVNGVNLDELNALNKQLREAARMSNLVAIKQALDQGAQINAPDDEGRTALIHAIFPGESLKTVKFLLRHGADPDVADEDSNTALMHARDLQSLVAPLLELNRQGRGNDTVANLLSLFLEMSAVIMFLSDPIKIHQEILQGAEPVMKRHKPDYTNVQEALEARELGDL